MPGTPCAAARRTCHTTPTSRHGARVAANCCGATTHKPRRATTPHNRRFCANSLVSYPPACISPRRFTATTAAVSSFAVRFTPTAAAPSSTAHRLPSATAYFLRQTSPSTASATRCIPSCAVKNGNTPHRLPSKMMSGVRLFQGNPTRPRLAGAGVSIINTP